VSQIEAGNVFQPDTGFCKLNNRREKQMLPNIQKKAFQDFYNSARNNGILDPKTTLLIHLASAMAFACYP